MPMNVCEAIRKVVDREDLTEEEMYGAINSIMSGEASPAQIASLLTGLRMKGETVAEITGAVRVMREKVTRIETGVDMEGGEVVVDTCGTGGDGSGTFNVSTTAAFVVAGCGITVAKHGNRSVSSSCGSADVLEAIGVKLDMTPEQVGACIREHRIGFLFASVLHGAMKYAIGPRKEIGIRTIFNILGPLTNPAGANVQVLGVFSEDLIVPLAEVLGKLGSRRALVVHGAGNLDELTSTGPTRIAELQNGSVRTYEITPEQFGMKRVSLTELKGGGNSAESAAIMKRILAGEHGPRRDMVLLNGGAAIMAAGRAEDLHEGIARAAECIDSGRALVALESLVAFSSRCR
jgi:anthranilate phosphoribosyltransferase